MNYRNIFLFIFLTLLSNIAYPTGFSPLEDEPPTPMQVPQALYNTGCDCFEFQDNSAFNQFLLEVDQYVESYTFENDPDIAYYNFDNFYSHSSLHSYILNEEELKLNNNTWTEVNDPDRHHVMDDILRMVLNQHMEVMIGSSVVTFASLCELITTSTTSGFGGLNTKRAAVEANDYSNLPVKYSNVVVECDEEGATSRKYSGGSCCVRSARTKEKYFEFSNTRKMKAVFWQRSYGSVNYHKIGGKTKSYRKNNNGNWRKKRADNIRYNFAGTIFQTNSDGTDCATAYAVDSNGETAYDSKKAKSCMTIPHEFWTENGGIYSEHRVADGGEVGRVYLCLNDEKCGGCETYSVVGDPPPPPVQQIVGSNTICGTSIETYHVENFNTNVANTIWTVSNNLNIISSTVSTITVEAISAAGDGPAHISIEYPGSALYSLPKSLWIGSLPSGGISIEDNEDPFYELTYLSAAVNSDLNTITDVDWVQLSASYASLFATSGITSYLNTWSNQWNAQIQVTATNDCSSVQDIVSLSPSSIVGTVPDIIQYASQLSVEIDNGILNKNKFNGLVSDREVILFSIYDISGSLIKEVAQKSSMSIPEYCQGVYIAKAVLSDGTYLKKNIVITQ